MNKRLLVAFCVIAIFGAAIRCPAANPATHPVNTRVKEIIVVCKTHFDIGYTHRVKDLLAYYRTTMIDRALKLMDESQSLPQQQQFAWTAPGWVMAKVLEDWPGQTPQRRQRLDDAMKSGKFVTHALPFTVESELMEPEDFARGFAFSAAVARKYALPLPEAAKMTDVPSHGGVLATALAQAGVKFMHIGCNWPSGYVKVPSLYWWEGPDGSRVLTYYSRIYGTSIGLTYPYRWGGDDPTVGHNLVPPADWPYKTWMALFVTPDNSGPPGAAAVKALFDEAAAKLPGVKVRMGRMEDFAAAIVAEKPDLPVIKAEAPDTWIHGCMCDPLGMRAAREVHALLPAMETLNTQLKLWKLPVPDRAADIARAYEQSLLYSEHTWGGAAGVKQFGDAFQQLPRDKFKNLEDSWEDKTDYIRTAAKIVTPAMESDLAALAGAVQCDGPRVVVYNPLPWKRSGIARINMTTKALKDVATGQTVSVAGGEFLASDVPPCGYKTYVPVDAAPVASNATAESAIENEFFRISLDPARGVISSLVDKRTGRECVDAAAAHGLGQYLNERFDQDQTNGYCRDYQQGRAGTWLHPGMSKPGLPAAKDVPYRAASPANGTITITRDAVAQTALLQMPGNPANHLPGSSLRATLHAGQPYVDLELTIIDKARDNWPEADWLCLPLNVKSPTFTVGRSLGAMDPARDILPGANRDLYAVGPGVMIQDGDGSGVAICPIDHPLISLDRPGCWKFSPDFVPKKAAVYVNLYNNQWNTNYRYWYAGTWSSRVRLWTFDRGADRESALATPALEARMPLQAATAQGRDPNAAAALPIAQQGIALSRKGVIVTAFGPNPDGHAGTLLRVWEQAGGAGDVNITLPPGSAATTATPVDLRGRKTADAVRVEAGSLKFNLGAYAPRSFILE